MLCVTGSYTKPELMNQPLFRSVNLFCFEIRCQTKKTENIVEFYREKKQGYFVMMLLFCVVVSFLHVPLAFFLHF